MYFKDSLHVIQRDALKLKSFQSIVWDFTLNNRTWCLYLVYCPPSSSKELFYQELQNSLDSAFTKYGNVLLMGDININTKDISLSQEYDILLSAFGMQHLFNEPTCFKNIENPTHLDHMVTNKRAFIKTSGVLDTGLSDFHRLTYTILKMHRPKSTVSTTMYRSCRGVNKG